MATGDKKGCELSLLQLGLRWDKKKVELQEVNHHQTQKDRLQRLMT